MWPTASCSAFEDEQFLLSGSRKLHARTAFFPTVVFFFFFFLPPPLSDCRARRVMQHCELPRAPQPHVCRLLRAPETVRGAELVGGSLAASRQDGSSSRLMRAAAAIPISSFLLSHAGGFTLASAALILPHGSTMLKWDCFPAGGKTRCT